MFLTCEMVMKSFGFVGNECCGDCHGATVDATEGHFLEFTSPHGRPAFVCCHVMDILNSYDPLDEKEDHEQLH